MIDLKELDKIHSDIHEAIDSYNDIPQYPKVVAIRKLTQLGKTAYQTIRKLITQEWKEKKK